jgi:hypothetical protein
MGVRGKTEICSTRRRATVAWLVVAIAATVVPSSSAGAAGRQPLVATTSTGSQAVLLVLGIGVLALGGIGFFIFVWSRRKRRPGQCAEQREALELAERSVRYWEAARAHLEAVERERTMVDGPADEPAHASLVAKAVEGLQNAMQQRDQCQMDLIHCMATGVPPMRLVPPTSPAAQPFFTPGSDGPAAAGPSTNP